MYQLEIDNTMADEEYEDIGDIVPLFNTAIAHGAQRAVIWLTRRDGSRHIIALHPIPQEWASHKNIKRGAPPDRGVRPCISTMMKIELTGKQSDLLFDVLADAMEGNSAVLRESKKEAEELLKIIYAARAESAQAYWERKEKLRRGF